MYDIYLLETKLGKDVHEVSLVISLAKIINQCLCQICCVVCDLFMSVYTLQQVRSCLSAKHLKPK